MDFADTLMKARMAFCRSEKANSIEPFVLIHGDMHGGNILMNGASIAGVLDWEFAGSYPLSDILRRGFGGQNSPWERRVKDIVLERVGEWKMDMLESYEEPAWARVRGLTTPLSETGEIAVYDTI
jgi:aminoglycoside phosphotransferase (APT) family kinase protein